MDATMPASTATELPLHIQVAQQIRQDIAEGRLSPGEQLPSLHALTNRYGAGIASIRRAVETLCEEEVLVSRQGKGVFVRSFQLAGYWNRFHRFQRLDGTLIQQFDDQLELFEVIPATTEIAPELGIQKMELVVHWRRSMHFDGHFSGFDEAWLPQTLFPHLTAEHFISRRKNESIYAIYEASDKIFVASAVDRIRAEVVDPDTSEFYRFPPGTPLLILRRTTRDICRRIIEFRMQTTEGHGAQICIE